MTPLFFGSAARRLFGIYEGPAHARSDPQAILICYPWGPEYLYAHRALRQLATMLVAAGHHVLRFDYHGTGDSGGDMTAEGLFTWENDVATAIAELQALSGIERVTIIGLRLGANLAGRASAKLPEREVRNLLLWDPIVDGSEYVAELFEACRAPHLKSGGAIARPEASGGGQEVLGYPLTPEWQKSLLDLHLKRLGSKLTARSFVVCSATDEEHRKTKDALAGVLSSKMVIEHYPGFPCWQEDWPVNVSIIPAEVLNRIVNWVG